SSRVTANTSGGWRCSGLIRSSTDSTSSSPATPPAHAAYTSLRPGASSRANRSKRSRTPSVMSPILAAPDRFRTRDNGGMSYTVNKTEDQWREELGDDQYAVLRTAATERAWTGELLDEKRDGLYRCGAC